MTLRQTLHAAPTKSTDLMAKLAATTNNAVKTREALLSKLKAELSRYIAIEEQHLLPLLGKRSGTKAIVSAAGKSNKNLRAKLVALDSAPKDNDEFMSLLGELNEYLQQGLQNGRERLVPAVLKVVSGEDAKRLSETIESAAVDARRIERVKQEVSLQAKRDAEAGEQATKAERAAATAGMASKRPKREAAQNINETVEHQVDILHEGSRRALEISDQAERDEAVARTALATLPTSAFDIHELWMDWFRKTARSNAEVTKRLFQCRTITQLGELQRDVFSGAMRDWIEGGSKLLAFARRTSLPRALPGSTHG